jgi:hypothetical protein
MISILPDQSSKTSDHLHFMSFCLFPLACSGGKSAFVTNTTVEIVIPEHTFGSVYGENGSNLARLRQVCTFAFYFSVSFASAVIVLSKIVKQVNQYDLLLIEWSSHCHTDNSKGFLEVASSSITVIIILVHYFEGEEKNFDTLTEFKTIKRIALKFNSQASMCLLGQTILVNEIRILISLFSPLNFVS